MYYFLTKHDSSELYILSSDPPFHIGKLLKSKEPIAVSQAWRYAKCPGYRVYFVHSGFLENIESELTEDDKKFISNSLQQMAYFYYDHRISQNPGRFRSYLD